MIAILYFVTSHTTSIRIKEHIYTSFSSWYQLEKNKRHGHQPIGCKLNYKTIYSPYTLFTVRQSKPLFSWINYWASNTHISSEGLQLRCVRLNLYRFKIGISCFKWITLQVSQTACVGQWGRSFPWIWFKMLQLNCVSIATTSWVVNLSGKVFEILKVLI